MRTEKFCSTSNTEIMLVLATTVIMIMLGVVVYAVSVPDTRFRPTTFMERWPVQSLTCVYDRNNGRTCA